MHLPVELLESVLIIIHNINCLCKSTHLALIWLTNLEKLVRQYTHTCSTNRMKILSMHDIEWCSVVMAMHLAVHVAGEDDVRQEDQLLELGDELLELSVSVFLL